MILFVKKSEEFGFETWVCIAGNSNGFCVFCAFGSHIEFSLASTGRDVSPWKFVENLSCILLTSLYVCELWYIIYLVMCSERHKRFYVEYFLAFFLQVMAKPKLHYGLNSLCYLFDLLATIEFVMDVVILDLQYYQICHLVFRDINRKMLTNFCNAFSINLTTAVVIQRRRIWL